MHCKSCLKRAQYFSKCMHPYCELCYKNTQIFCNDCKVGEVGMTQNKIWELIEKLSLRETYPTYSSIKSWFCGYF